MYIQDRGKGKYNGGCHIKSKRDSLVVGARSGAISFSFHVTCFARLHFTYPSPPAKGKVIMYFSYCSPPPPDRPFFQTAFEFLGTTASDSRKNFSALSKIRSRDRPSGKFVSEKTKKKTTRKMKNKRSAYSVK